MKRVSYSLRWAIAPLAGTTAALATTLAATLATTLTAAMPGQAQTAQSPFTNTADFASFQLALFDDVTEGYWAKAFVDALLEQDVLEGFPNGDFRPNDPLTWGQFAAMLSQAFDDLPPSRNLEGFPSGINRSHWSYSSLESLYQIGFDFPAINPDQTLTRLEILSLLVDRFDFEPSGGADVVDIYSDINSVPAENRALIAAATTHGLMVNHPNARMIEPSRVATRGEMAAMLYQTLTQLELVSPIESPFVAAP
ncbi:MAG: S-layer homology domain-containing protein [Cyanobacteria bacterium P01_G01_bin.54]